MTTITYAASEDLPRVLALLEQCGLPQAGLDTATPQILVAWDEETLVGCAALEEYGTAALLRSVAVDPARRSHKVGSLLVQQLLDYAREHGIHELYLLTETAGDYFPRFGFRPIAREAVSPAIHQSIEWTSACPDSAQAMALELKTA
jgi:amino-acid N-acetyltransferase